MTSTRAQAGMTLIEVLLATAILGFMLVMAWSTTAAVVDAQRYFETMQERNHEIRVALDRMAKDIASAYISGNEDESLDDRRTWFVAKDSRPVPEIRFSSLAHRSLWSNANESEQTLISYHAERDRDQRGQTNLLRRESRRLSNEQWDSEPADVDLLVRDIVRVEMEFFDPKDNDWQDSWDSTGADAERSRLPERVRIKLVLEEGDREVEYETQARIMLQEKLVF
ncbi:MAG: type II secretion system protein GspJ [Haliangiales bacterium]